MLRCSLLRNLFITLSCALLGLWGDLAQIPSTLLPVVKLLKQLNPRNANKQGHLGMPTGCSTAMLCLCDAWLEHNLQERAEIPSLWAGKYVPLYAI